MSALQDSFTPVLLASRDAAFLVVVIGALLVVLIRLLESAGSGGYSSPGLVGVVESRFSLRTRLAAIGCYRGTARPWLTASAAVVVSGIAAVGLTQAPAKKSAEPPPQAVEGARQETPRFGEGAQVELSVKLWRLREGQPDELIATSTAVTMPGQWVLFEDSSEIRFPTDYGLPNLPEDLSTKAKGGGSVGDEGEGNAWTTNPGTAVLPPHPSAFEKSSLGWSLKLRPDRTPDGSIRVAGVFEQTGLKGFTNRGIPITIDQPSGLFGRKKSEIVTENRQLLPVFLERNQELRFEPEGDRLVATVMADAEAPEDDDAGIVEGFGDSLREARLPGFRVEVLAKPVELEAVGKRDGQGGSSDSVYVMTRFLETDVNLSDEGRELAGLGSPLLTEAQFQPAIRSLSARKGVDLLTGPSIFLESGESELFELIREFQNPLDYDPPQAVEQWENGVRRYAASPATPISFTTVRLGLQLQIKASLLPDGWIELDLSPSISGHREFLNFGGQIRHVDNGKLTDILLSENRIVMPVFDASSQRMIARVPDGHTIVLCGLVHDYEFQVEDKLPVIGLDSDSKRVVERRFLYVFITPQLVD